jgi:hypothetical protein
VSLAVSVQQITSCAGRDAGLNTVKIFKVIFIIPVTFYAVANNGTYVALKSLFFAIANLSAVLRLAPLTGPKQHEGELLGRKPPTFAAVNASLRVLLR